MSKYNKELIPEFRNIKHKDVTTVTFKICKECGRPTLETIEKEERCWSCDYIRRFSNALATSKRA